ncbi:hypothetical protein WKW50_24840 [Ochrobactrum sp. GPK 3]|uniref:hypothetical protein n=1 Tax=Brucella sp. 22210 TaxID=3453892 RepID=UPI003138540D
MKNLIYLSPVPWASFAQRPQKFVNWFHAQYGGEVLWIEPYATRFPSWHDLKRARHTPVESHSAQVPSWLTRIKVSSIPIEPLPGSAWLNQYLWKRVIGAAVDFANVGDCSLVIGKPSVLAITLMKTLPDIFAVYDAMDDFPAFYRGLSRQAMRWREAQVMAKADEVWTSSTVLYDRVNLSPRKMRLIKNGLDAAAVEAIKPIEANPDQKVFGYIGTIGAWFDWDMVIALARAAPNDIVRIIGPIFKAPPKNLPANIELLPPCEHALAMEYMGGMDVGLIPFLKNELTASVDPIKYYEYRALGMPVISTAFGEMLNHGSDEDTFLVNGLGEIACTVNKARASIRSKRLDIAFVQANSWDARFNQTMSKL